MSTSDETSTSLDSSADPVGQCGHDAGDAAPLEQVEVARDRRRGGALGTAEGEAGDGVEHHQLRFVLLDELVQHREVLLEPERRRSHRPHLQKPRVDPAAQVEADRTHVANQLFGRLLEGEEQGLLSALAGGVRHEGADAGLARACGAADHHRRPAVDATGQHLVETRDARGDPLGRRFIGQAHGRDRHHHEPTLGDQEGKLVRPVEGTAVLDDAQASGRDLVVDAVVQGDHTVRDVLLDAEAGQVSLPAALAADHDGQVALLEPPEQPAELASDDGLVGQRAEQQLDGVEEDSLGADGLDGHGEPDEQALEVEGAGLDDLGGVQPEGVDRQQPVPLELVEVEAERRDVGGQVGLGLLEGQEDARLTEVSGAPHQELDAEQRLAGASRPRHQGRPSTRQAAAGDLVETGDAGRRLVQRQPSRRRRQSRAAAHVPSHAIARSLPRRGGFGAGFEPISTLPVGGDRPRIRTKATEGSRRPPMRLLRLPSPCERRSGSSRASSGRPR